MRVCKNLD